MTQLNAETLTSAQLAELRDSAEVRDASGQLLGYFLPATGNRASIARTPVPIEELERRRQQREGRPLREFLDELQRGS